MMVTADPVRSQDRIGSSAWAYHRLEVKERMPLSTCTCGKPRMSGEDCCKLLIVFGVPDGI